MEGSRRGFHGSVNLSLHSVLVHYSKETVSMFLSLFYLFFLAVEGLS